MGRKRLSRHVTVSGPAKNQLLGASKVLRPLEEARHGAKAQAEARKRAQERFQALTSGLDEQSLRVLAELRGDPTETPQDPTQAMVDSVMALEPGDTSAYHPLADDPDGAVSDLRGDEAVAHALRDLLDPRLRRRRAKDNRSWHHRLHNLDIRWREILPRLTDVYLRWMARHTDPIPAAEPSEFDFEIDVLDLDTLQFNRLIPRRDIPAVDALVLEGYLPATPDQPTIAVSLPALELYRTLRLVKPSFSVEAFTKLLCYKYCIPYRRRFRRAVADTFDIYLTIVENVRSRVFGALGRQAPNWRVLHGCPACSYKVEGETPATYERMIVMDGNNSLKRFAPVGNRGVGDTRTFESDYYLPMDFVDRFANEVKGRQSQPHVAVPVHLDGSRVLEEDGDADSDWEDENPEAEGDPTDGAPDTACASNWKAAAKDEKKRTWSAFWETGIFASACRHGRILWLIDMVKSGELAKFPLATVAKMLDIVKEKILVGFDIGCVFKTTLANSSLGAQFKASGSRVCVNAFHGYSHSYPCQVQHHPNVINGIGLEDLETLERTFSKSNELAAVIRFASAYRRRALIHTFFQQYDEEKYTALGAMLYDNYVQAVEIIQDLTPKLAESLRVLDVDLATLKTWETEELDYFKNLQDESSEDLFAVAYVEGLQELRALRTQLDSTNTRFLSQVPADYQFMITSSATDYAGDTSATRRLERERRDLKDRIQRLNIELFQMERSMNIHDRWEPADSQYQATIKYIATRRYQQALGRLQRLVIQRLFELQKMNLSHTAYRIRTHIAKSLQKRCKAIRAAVKAYNIAALALDPPRPTLDWSKVSHFSFLEEFTLLNDTRNDIREKPWGQPLVRETMRTARRIKRATEELDNVHREARRIHTSIADEDAHFTRVLADLKAGGDVLYVAVAEFCTRRRANNAHILSYLRRLYALEGYGGKPTPGTYSGAPRETWTPRSASGLPPPDAPSHNASDSQVRPSPPTIEALTRTEESAAALEEEEEDFEVDEDGDGGVSLLVDHLASIAVVM